MTGHNNRTTLLGEADNALLKLIHGASIQRGEGLIQQPESYLWQIEVESGQRYSALLAGR